MKINCIFLWNELPEYAATLLYEISKEKRINLLIITNQNKVYKIKKRFSSLRVLNIKNRNFKNQLNSILEHEEPNYVFSSGWAYKDFNNLVSEFKKRFKRAFYVLMVDNNFKKNFKQKLGKFYFKFFIKDNYNFFWVPGKSGSELMKYYGVKKNKIFEKLYCYDEKIFRPKKHISKRLNNFVFVGQAIYRKGFDLITKAFEKIKNKNKSLRLIIVTNTKKKDINGYNKLKNNKNIIFKFNQSPNQVSNILNNNMYMILISREDHWPLAFLESTACGNICFISNRIGSIKDLKNKSNFFIIKKLTIKNVINNFSKILKLKKEEHKKIYKYNLQISKKYKKEYFLKAFYKIIKINENKK